MVKSTVVVGSSLSGKQLDREDLENITVVTLGLSLDGELDLRYGRDGGNS